MTSFRRIILTGLAIASVTAVAPAGPPAEGQADLGVRLVPDAPLEADPNLRSGRLANGLRWVFERTDDPSAGASLSLIVSAGAIHEPEGVQGAAHLASRLVFSDSATFAPGELESALRRAGIGVNRLQNVYSSFDSTAYHIDLPSPDERALELVLRMFAELPGGLVFDDATVERERTLALRDEKLRRNPIQRLDEQIIPRLFPGTAYAAHPPSGTTEGLARVRAEALEAFAREHYTADRMTVIVAGAFEPMLVEHAIEHAFEEIDGAENPAGAALGRRGERDQGGCERSEIVLSDPELPYAVVQAIRILDAPPGERTTSDLARSVRMDVALEALRQRVERQRCAGLAINDTRTRTAGISASLTSTTIATLNGPDVWDEALATLATQASMAQRHGFTAHEVELAKNAVLSRYDEEAIGALGDEPGSVARRLGRLVVLGSSPITPRMRADSAREVLRAIGVREVNETFRDVYDPSCYTLFVLLPEGADEPSEREVRTVFDAAVRAAAELPAEQGLFARAETPSTLGGKPGAVARLSIHPSHGVLSATLGNNIRVHHKPLTGMDGLFTVTLTLAGGRLDEDGATRGLTEATGAFWDAPAIEGVISCDLSAALAASSMELDHEIGTDAVTVSLTAPSERAEQAFAILTALIESPVLEQRALDRWKGQKTSEHAYIRKQPRTMLNVAIVDSLYPLGDPRHRALCDREIAAIELEPTRRWLEELCATAPIEASVVGDLERSVAMDLVSRSLGTLRTRGAIGERLGDASRLLTPRDHPISVELDVPSIAPNSVTLLGFRGPGAGDVATRLNLDVAMRILGARLDRSLKGEDSGVASVQANAYANDAYPDFGLLYAMAEVEPGKSGEALAELEHHAADLAFTGPTPEEVDLARRLAYNELKGDRSSPRWWARTLGSLGYRGLTLDALDEEMAILESIDVRSVQDTVETYHDSSRKIVITIHPVAR